MQDCGISNVLALEIPQSCLHWVIDTTKTDQNLEKSSTEFSLRVQLTPGYSQWNMTLEFSSFALTHHINGLVQDCSISIANALGDTAVSQ